MSWGIFIGAIPLYAWFRWTHTVPWWMLLLSIVISLIADRLIYGFINETTIALKDE